jgi:hypothetical protein
MKTLIVIFSLLCSSCYSEKGTSQKNNSGLVTVKIQVFDTTTSEPNLSYFYKMWFCDSLVIEEVKKMAIIEDTSGMKRSSLVVDHYAFINLGSKIYKYYRNLSDTAKPYSKYQGVDSFKFHGGWSFEPQSLKIIGSAKDLSDTIIENIRYERTEFNTIKGVQNCTTVGYFRCDKKGTLFRFHELYKHQHGCPMVKVEDRANTNSKARMFSEIVFEKDSLSNLEKHIFETWKYE